VYARLIVKGKDYGVKTFVVQLRDPETFELMPGVNIGDCGAKMVHSGLKWNAPFSHEIRAVMGSTTAGFSLLKSECLALTC
jgi:alkylation response protein AidB-like acyl-CoA dehydrogenase